MNNLATLTIATVIAFATLTNTTHAQEINAVPLVILKTDRKQLGLERLC